jgi:uracil-DNA glycosylase family 4
VPPATESSDHLIQRLDALRREVEESPCCQLFGSRTRLVFGEGDPNADLMFVGEAPGYHEDQQGRPFVGAAGKLLEELLASIGLKREQVYIANVLKCRPPNNRDPLPAEIAACEPYLWRQIELIAPRVVCSLGNHATKLLSGKPLGITKVHGRPQAVSLGRRTVHLYPIFHPAAALYTPAMLTTLKEDFRRLPEVLALPLPEAAEEAVQDALLPADDAAPSPGGTAADSPAAAAGPAEQLGLF